MSDLLAARAAFDAAATAWGDACEAFGRAAAEAEAAVVEADLRDQLGVALAAHDAAVADLAALRAECEANEVTYLALRAAFTAHMATHEPVPEPVPLKVIGMSSPADVWDQRLAQVGPDGVTARRIFAWLKPGGNDQMNLAVAAVDAGMMPVVSYKASDIPGAIGGGYDEMAAQAAANLDALGVPVRLAIWHEPHGDMTPTQFVALNERLLPIFKRGQIKVGCFLNGWLLDRRVPDFDALTSPTLFGLWDWFGIDTYESGTITAPGDIKPADRIPELIAYLESKGSDLPIGIGEYNGYSAETIAAAGEAFLSCERLEFACMWNSTTGKGYVLEGARLAAFQATTADPRVQQ